MICRQCGLACNALTCIVKFGNLPKQPSYSASAYRFGKCDLCGREAAVTEERDFFYPETKYINWKSFGSALNKSIKGGK